MKPLYIFDLDGTIALLSEKRQRIIEDTSNPYRWRDFYAACDTDLPNVPVITTLLTLQKGGADVLIWSARSDEVMGKTIQWLRDQGMSYGAMRMRPAGNTEPDTVIKGRYLEELAPDVRARIVAVFDDRDKVVAFWRSKGIACFQVAEGKF